jgi:hypothetical protein
MQPLFVLLNDERVMRVRGQRRVHRCSEKTRNLVFGRHSERGLDGVRGKQELVGDRAAWKGHEK